jgi:hypothetical protein
MVLRQLLVDAYLYEGKSAAEAKDAGREFQVRLEKDVTRVCAESITNQKLLQELLSSPSWVASRAWTSTERCKAMLKEWCGVLQWALRTNDEALIGSAVQIYATMNMYSVSDRHDVAALNKVEWPVTENPETLEIPWVLHRGGRLPDQHVQWYKDAIEKKIIYRVGIALPTSKVGQRAMEFMMVHSYPDDAPMLYTRYNLSKVLKCMHVNCFERVTLVPKEQEFLFPPFSAFRATKLEKVSDCGIDYWMLEVDVLPDNRSVAQGGSIPIRAPTAPWA